MINHNEKEYEKSTGIYLNHFAISRDPHDIVYQLHFDKLKKKKNIYHNLEQMSPSKNLCIEVMCSTFSHNKANQNIHGPTLEIHVGFKLLLNYSM